MGGEIARIHLTGEPYQKNMDGEIIDCTKVLENLAKNANYASTLRESVERNKLYLTPLFEEGYYGIDRRIKKGQSLDFPEAFSLMSFVSMGVNWWVYDILAPQIRVGTREPETILYQSIALLAAMSAKEAYVGLTPDEIAGLVAATLEIDTVCRIPTNRSVIGIGGMGGDKGYEVDGRFSKLFSVSTLAAIVLSNFGDVHKHHSYPNTSKVAGQSAIEAFGARSDQSDPRALQFIQEKTGLLMTSCHTIRLIHTLSHHLKGETVNHVIGPLAFPVDRNTEVNAFIGVNEKVHPEDIIRALIIMQKHGIQRRYLNSVAFCGLNSNEIPESIFNPSQYYSNVNLKSLIAVDEVAPPPYPTLAAFLVNGRNMGTYLISPEDFMDGTILRQVNWERLFVPNSSESIINANAEAIKGEDIPKALYLAMTAALGLFTREYASFPGAFDPDSRRINPIYLREAFQKAYEVIRSGAAYIKLQEYVETTKQTVKRQP